MTATLQHLKPTQIWRHEKNPRHDVGDVSELAASIREKGILEPLIVAPNTGNRYVLIAGHRRLRASLDAGLETVPCVVRDDLTDAAEQLEAMLVENLHREDLTPIEEAEAYQLLLEFPGYTIKRITQSIARSADTIRSRIRLTRLSDRTREKIQARQISLADAQVLAEFADEPATLNLLESNVGTVNWSWAVERAREDRKQRKAEERELAQLRKTGVRVFTPAQLDVRVFTPAQLDELEAAEEARADESDTEYDDPWVSLDELRLTPEDHADCPGHAASVGMAFRGDLEPFYLCTEPKRHPISSNPPNGPSPEQTAEAEARARRDQLIKDLTTAAAIRRKHVLTAGPTLGEEGARVLLADLIGQLLNTGAFYYAKKLVGQALGFTGFSQRDLIEALDKQPVGVLAVILDLTINSNAEDALTRPDAWPSGPDARGWAVNRTKDWRDRLTAFYGYEWSAVEAELNTEPPPAIVDADLPDEDPS